MEIYKDSTKTVAERVEDLLSKMTLEEKAAQLCGNLPASFMHDGKVDAEMLKETFPNGIGRITQYSLTGLCDPATIAKATNALQHYCIEETRLGIPAALQSESLCGYPGAKGTLFPAMINAGSTWEPELVSKMAGVIGSECRSLGITSVMSPVIDCARDSRWGRVYETFGEDWYLNSQMGVAYISANQGKNKEGAACIAKHFLGYSETQGGLNCSAARMGDRELYEVFATPFEAAAKVADVSGMMANYGEIDGLNVCANPKIAEDLLRKKMGFRGMLTSDGAGVMRLWNHYHLTRTYEEAGLLAKKCGVDTEIPVGGSFAKLPEYIREGKLEEKKLDESVRRILTIKFEYGLFEHPYVDEDPVVIAKNLVNEEKNSLSTKIASDSIILLKNNGVLPLKKGTKVALIGPHADSLRYPISGYTYPAYIEMVDASRKNQQTSIGGMEDVSSAEKGKKKPTMAFGAGMFNLYSKEELANLGSMIDVIRHMNGKSLKEELSNAFDVRYAEGCSITGTDKDGFQEAEEAAKASDVCVLALGGNCGWVNVTGGEGKDRSSYELPGVQEELLETVAAAGKPVVVILYGPGIFSVRWAKQHADAIVQAFMPGPKAGLVLTNILDGTTNPGGKLTLTIPESAGQTPTYYNHHVGSGYSDGADATEATIFSGGYVNESWQPLFPFGYGLSYTSFAVSDLALETKEVPTDGTIHLSATVTNTGDREGSEVVQLYTHFLDAHVVRPNKQLSGFQKVTLKPGEKKTVKFALSTRQLGYYNENMEFVVEPGELQMMLGTSSEDLPLKTSVQLTGESVNVMGRRVYTCPCEVL